MLASIPNKKNTQDIISLSQKIIKQLYTENPFYILSYASQSIVWVDTTNFACLTGYYQLQNFLQKFEPVPTCIIQHLQYHLLPLDSGSVIVTGQYRLIHKTTARKRTDRTYQISIVWAYGELQPQLMYLHISAAMPRLKDSPTLLFSGRGSEMYRLAVDDIIYIEAENIHCKLHGILKTYHLNHSISQIEQQLPEQFLRVHRSYIINRTYVTRIYRYAAELCYQYSIPIPEKKYMKVLCEIESYEKNSGV